LPKPTQNLPQVQLQEMILAFRDVVSRAAMFAHHHVQRERLSVRERMSEVLANVQKNAFVEFQHLFKVEEGRMGVTVTFVALLELLREGMIELVQTEAFGPLHVRAAGPQHGLRLVSDNVQPTSVADE
jgi:segregation and condensation protein A